MSQDIISEAASENQPRRKRGRPPAPLRKLVVGHIGKPGDYITAESGAKTVRGQQNAEYAWWAAHRLFDLREQYPKVLEFTGFCRDDDGKEGPDYGHTKRHIGVLAELGRILQQFGEHEQAAKLATELVLMRPRPTSKDAAIYLRRWRFKAMGKPPEAKVGHKKHLAVAIAKVIDDYRLRNPEMKPEDVVEVLRWLADQPV
jgi:hypothetical protein